MSNKISSVYKLDEFCSLEDVESLESVHRISIFK